jgi:hypothetical protein
MDWPAWKRALQLLVETPELIAMAFVGVCAVFAFAWWLRSHIGQERIAALEERLRLAADEQKPLTRQIQTLMTEVASLTQRAPPEMAASIAGMTGTVRGIEKANIILGSTLTPGTFTTVGPNDLLDPDRRFRITGKSE